MIKIFTENDSSRFNYICEVLFDIILNVPYRIFSNEKEFLSIDGPGINYSNREIEGCFHIIPGNDILYETNISYKSVNLIKEEGNVYLFCNNPSKDIKFDVFAASFWMITRYEEYLESKKDKHGRFRASKSLAYMEDFLKQPIVNEYAFLLFDALKAKWPKLTREKKDYKIYPTIDVDNAYAFLHKGFIRSTGSIISRFLKLKWSELFYQLKVLLGFTSDPYDTYAYLSLISKKYKLIPKYFFLLGDYGKYDKNLPYDSKHLRKLISGIKAESPVGIHPSYGADNTLQLKREIDRLDEIISKPVEISRQHYIKLNLPETYERLIDNGIKHDYSMGFPTRTGFRAGIANPFPFFNLKTNTKTELTIHPFFFMDTTLIKYQRIKTRKIMDYLSPLIQKVKDVEGNVAFIFHNESPGGWKHWKNWSTLYEDIMKLCK